MHCLLEYFFSLLLLLILRNDILVESTDVQDIQKDIDNFNMTCNNDKCKNQVYDRLSTWNCHCGKQCVQLGTCCLDSPYIDDPQPERKLTCRSVYNGASYFIVDDCPSDSAWARLCYNEWHRGNDIKRLVPVTSNLTSITYKNYFCFKCHETHDKFLYWSVMIQSKILQPSTHKDVAEHLNKNTSFTYNKNNDTWMVTYDENIGYFPVNISIEIPFEPYNLTQYCERDVISTCHDEWYDEEVRNKCHSYMSLKEVKKRDVKLYKNMHCALCNMERLIKVNCRMIVSRPFSDDLQFSFTHLLDINSSGGTKVGKIERCADGEFWDYISEKCRKLKCLLSGYKVKDGKCVPE